MSITPTTAYEWHETEREFEEHLREEHLQAVMKTMPDLAPDQASALIDAGRPLFEATAGLGWVDGWGGSEATRVHVEALAFVRHRANCPPSRECPMCEAVDAWLEQEVQRRHLGRAQ